MNSRQKCSIVQQALRDHLNSFKHELVSEVKLTKAKFMDGNFTQTLDVLYKDGQTKEEAYFLGRCWEWGLEPTDLGRTFQDETGRTFKITGAKKSARKRPIQTNHVGTSNNYAWVGKAVKGFIDKENAKVFDEAEVE